MHALIYCRVSTEEQAREGYSLDAQEKMCRTAAQARGYAVQRVYRDEGKSGTSLNRPALQDLLAECQSDKSIGAVIVQETDRLSRNTLDHLTIRMLLKKADVALVAVNQPMLDDSPEGKMIDTILASVNQFQSDLNGRKTSKALQEKFEDGWWPGWAPLGYVNVPVHGDGDPTRRSRKMIVKDPERWPLIRKAFDLYLTSSYSADALGGLLYQAGLRSKTGKRPPHNTIINTLRNPFYAGIIRWKGQTRIGNHPPLITMSEHHRVLEIVAARNQHACRRRKHHFYLRGFVFCGICGGRYTAEVHKLKNKTYYHCAARNKHSNAGQNIEAHDLEAQVVKQFKTIQLGDDLIKRALHRLQTLSADQQTAVAAQRKVLWNQRRAAETARDQAEAKLLKGVLNDESFCRLRDRLQMELIEIDAGLESLERQRGQELEVLRTALSLLLNIHEAYQNAPASLKSQYLGVFWDRFVIKDRKIESATPSTLVRAMEGLNHAVISGSRLLRDTTLIITDIFSDRDYLFKVHSQLQELTAALGRQGLMTAA